MEIKKFLNRKFLLFFGLGLILGILIILKLSQKKPEPVPLPSPAPTAKATPTPTPTPVFGDPTYFQEMEEKNENFYPLLKYLPYETQNFKIKYIDPLKLEVLLTNVNQDEAKEKALEWLKSINADLEKHTLIFTTP